MRQFTNDLDCDVAASVAAQTQFHHLLFFFFSFFFLVLFAFCIFAGAGRVCMSVSVNFVITKCSLLLLSIKLNSTEQQVQNEAPLWKGNDF